MLLLLLLAKGWAVTRIQLTWRPLLFIIWLLYGVAHILLYIWNKVIYSFEWRDTFENNQKYLRLLLSWIHFNFFGGGGGSINELFINL